MDISQLLSNLFNPPASQPQQPNIPQEVLNCYPTSFIDSPKASIQTTNQPNIMPNQNNIISMLGNMLPKMLGGGLDAGNLIKNLAGGNTNILSLLGNLNKPKPKQQKNSPKYDEFKKIEDYNF